MFAAHPELERDLFNRGNQAQGDQQRALAGAVASYATLLVTEGGPDPQQVLGRIAHKHASLGITEDQYPIVHEHLFAAIVEVLGDAVTPEVAGAWDEVYWHMAHTLVTIEKGLYAATGVADGDVWRTPGGAPAGAGVARHGVVRARVAGRRRAAGVPPGQYVSVAVRLPDGARQIRQYSLTGGRAADEWAITVKAVAAGRGDGDVIVPAGEVSGFLHHNVFEGDEVTVSAPFGDMVLDQGDAPLVLLSAGIGVTPILGMLRHLRDEGSTREVLVVHADRSPARHAHRQELKELVAELPSATLHRWYEDLGTRPARDVLSLGRVDLAGLALPADALVYLCGPLPFMESAREALLARGLPVERIHYEVFGPDTWRATA